MSAGKASVATIDRLMGHDGGPTPDRLRSDSDRPVVLVGVVPAVHAYQPESSAAIRISTVLDRVSIMVTFVIWVVLPVLGILRLVVSG